MIDRDALSRDIDTLAGRIDARSREFRMKGEFAHLTDKIDWLTERQRRLRGKLNAVDNSAWDSTKDDLAKEHSALYDDFVKFEEELDADAMHPGGRAPGAKSGLV